MPRKLTDEEYEQLHYTLDVGVEGFSVANSFRFETSDDLRADYEKRTREDPSLELEDYIGAFLQRFQACGLEDDALMSRIERQSARMVSWLKQDKFLPRGFTL
jgi:hypothetical protein